LLSTQHENQLLAVELQDDILNFICYGMQLVFRTLWVGGYWIGGMFKMLCYGTHIRYVTTTVLPPSADMQETHK